MDLGALRAARPFEGDAALALEACADTHLNALMALGPKAWSALRLALSRALREGAAQRALIEPLLVPQAEAEFTTPARIGDYTDFYISVHHATAVGKQFRPDNPLLPNYKWVPIGYHGRASSIGVEQRFARPVGQQRPAVEGEAPLFGPSKRLDYELELSIFVGQGNAQGDRVALASAEQHVFGLGILNDWSARDIQAWEYQPWGLSWPRTSPPPSRPGSSRSKRSNPSARNGSAPKAIRSPCPTWHRKPTAPRAPSMCRWKC